MLRVFAMSNALSVTIGAALVLCLPHLGWMILWLLAFTFYLGAMIWWGIELEHVERSQLPADRGLPEPSTYPPMPECTPPFRFVGMSEQGRAMQKHRGGEQP
jgi:hypothetical protein